MHHVFRYTLPPPQDLVPCVDAEVAGADAEDAEFDAAENFMPLDDMEQGQEPEEHVDRQQVLLLFFLFLIHLVR